MTGNTQNVRRRCGLRQSSRHFHHLQKKGELDVGFDCSKDFHVFLRSTGWRNKPIWLLDGKVIKQTYYEWHGPPAHIVAAKLDRHESLGRQAKPKWSPTKKQWDYVIDYIRVWDHKSGALDVPVFFFRKTWLSPPITTEKHARPNDR